MSPDPARVAVETLASPLTYSQHQLRDAYQVAYQLRRGLLVYTVKPEGDHEGR